MSETPGTDAHTDSTTVPTPTEVPWDTPRPGESASDYLERIRATQDDTQYGELNEDGSPVHPDDTPVPVESDPDEVQQTGADLRDEPESEPGDVIPAPVIHDDNGIDAPDVTDDNAPTVEKPVDDEPPADEPPAGMWDETPPGAATPDNIRVENDPNAAQFQGGTGHNESEDDATAEPPEAATGDTVGTRHQENVPDETVDDNAPIPATADTTEEWDALRQEVAHVKRMVEEMHEFVSELAPLISQLGSEVQEKGPMGMLMSIFRS